jgi:PleD family two-component response regulator
VRTAAGLQVTASFGVAEREKDEDLKSWLYRADQAMLAAKRAGRNRVLRASTLRDEPPAAVGAR